MLACGDEQILSDEGGRVPRVQELGVRPGDSGGGPTSGQRARRSVIDSTPGGSQPSLLLMVPVVLLQLRNSALRAVPDHPQVARIHAGAGMTAQASGCAHRPDRTAQMHEPENHEDDGLKQHGRWASLLAKAPLWSCQVSSGWPRPQGSADPPGRP